MSDDSKHGMDAERFRALVEAYGGDRKRWPEDRRGAADIFAATKTGRAMVEDASRLDALLALPTPPSASTALTGRILKSADKRITLRRRLHRWLVGAGLIGVGLAGGLTGALAVAVVAPPTQIPMTDTATAFGNIMTEGEIAQEIR